MKYQFNEQELLSLFYDKENDMRPDMAAPYLKNGYVCATEAHILIRIKAETLNGKYNEIEGLNIDFPADNCNFIIGLQDIRTAIASIPQVEEKEKVGKDSKNVCVFSNRPERSSSNGMSSRYPPRGSSRSSDKSPYLGIRPAKAAKRYGCVS